MYRNANADALEEIKKSIELELSRLIHLHDAWTAAQQQAAEGKSLPVKLAAVGGVGVSAKLVVEDIDRQINKARENLATQVKILIHQERLNIKEDR